MITDKETLDLDGDGLDELVLAGEWTPIIVLSSNGNELKNVSEQYFDQRYVGAWFALEMVDLDNDGDDDLVAGNLGLNNKFHPSLRASAQDLYG